MSSHTLWLTGSLLLLLVACSEPDVTSASNPGVQIIERAREVHGADVLDQARVQFLFRDASYEVERDSGRFHYRRTYLDSLGREHVDVLDNDSLWKIVDGDTVAVPDSARGALLSSLNSVPYFSLLPYNLADPAVRARFLGSRTVGERAYDVVEVTFEEEGGGPDHEDRYVYWFDRVDHTIEYLAYYYHTDGGGSRFREAVNERTIGGVRFADYKNYRSDSIGQDIERYADIVGTPSLELVSVVEIDSVRVDPLP